MRRWKLEAVLEDDGIEDPDKEIKGKYFTKDELLKDHFKFDLTAGLRLRYVRLKLLEKGRKK